MTGRAQATVFFKQKCGLLVTSEVPFQDCLRQGGNHLDFHAFQGTEEEEESLSIALTLLMYETQTQSIDQFTHV